MIETNKQTVLYIDGQNFMTRIRSILRRRGVTDIDLAKFDFWGMLGKIFKDQQVDLVQIYFAKLHAHKDTAEKSEELLKREEELKALLEKQGIKYITAGSVRPRKRGDEIEFVEKGVDIRIAVDMVTDVIDGVVGTVLLASSDSDMQPAIYEIKRRGAAIWYVGFASRMNRGLMLTTDRYVLIDNADIAKFYGGAPYQSAVQGGEQASQASAVPPSPKATEGRGRYQASVGTAQTMPAVEAAVKEPVVQLRNQRVTTIGQTSVVGQQASVGQPQTTAVKRPKPPVQTSVVRHPPRAARVETGQASDTKQAKPVVSSPPASQAQQETEFNVPPWTRRDI